MLSPTIDTIFCVCCLPSVWPGTEISLSGIDISMERQIAIFFQKRMSGRRHPLLLRLKNIITYLSGGRGWCTASSIDRNCITHGTKEWHVLHYIKLQALGINNNGRCSLNSFVSEIKAHCDVRFQSVFDLPWFPWNSVNSYRSWL